MDDEMARLDRKITKSLRLLVADMGVERARQSAQRVLERAKSYAPDDWKAIMLRQTSLEMLEVCQSYEAAELSIKKALDSWPSAVSGMQSPAANGEPTKRQKRLAQGASPEREGRSSYSPRRAGDGPFDLN